MARITIDGHSIVGNNITIRNGVVTVDGSVVGRDATNPIVEVRVLEGCIENIQSDASVTCQDVGGNVDAGGSVRCGNVGGSVDAGGSAQVGNVQGNVDAGGSVSASSVTGRVDAGGSVRIG